MVNSNVRGGLQSLKVQFQSCFPKSTFYIESRRVARLTGATAAGQKVLGKSEGRPGRAVISRPSGRLHLPSAFCGDGRKKGKEKEVSLDQNEVTTIWLPNDSRNESPRAHFMPLCVQEGAKRQQLTKYR